MTLKNRQNLPDSVHTLNVDGKEIYLVGTAHVSLKSVDDVKTAIEAVHPDSVCVELCESRHKAMMSRDAWEKMNILRVIKEKKALFLLAQLIMTSFYRRIGEKLSVQPGAEMMEAVHLARENNSELVLADRNIEVTLKRVWGALGFLSKLKMVFQLLSSFFIAQELDEKLIEDMKEQDQLEHLLEMFTNSFPGIKKRLIDERDIYLSQKIKQSQGKTVVAVIGAAHIPGIKKYILEDMPLEPIMDIPPKSIIPSILKWIIPALIIALVVAGFFKGDSHQSMESIYIWVLVNGILSAAGAAIAFAHPLTILASFFAAPITSLNPMIAAGWVSGLVQAKVKEPTVSDLKNLPVAISSIRGFWINPVSRILLVVVLANLGSALGTFIAGGWIAMNVF